MARKTTAPDETETPPEAPPPPGNRFFAWLRALDLPRQPGWIGGVCAGIAARLGIDPLIVRGIAVVVAILGGPAFLLYAAAWLLLPDQKNKIHLEELFRGRLESPIAGIGVLVLLSLLPVTQGFWYAGSAFWGEPYWGMTVGRALWTIAVLAAIVWFVVWISRRAGRASMTPTVSPATTDGRPDTIPDPVGPQAPPAGAPTEAVAAWRERQQAWREEREEFRTQRASERADANRVQFEETRKRRMLEQEAYREARARTRPHPLFSFIAIGLALVAGGLVALTFSDTELDARAIGAGLATTAAVMALGVIVNGIVGKRGGGAGALAVIALIPLLFIAIVPPSSHITYAGGAQLRPTDRPGTDDTYYVGFGDVQVDLTHYFDDSPAPDPDNWATEAITLYVASGDVYVKLPSDVPVGIDASVGSGAIDFDASDGRPGRSDRWWGETHFYALPGDPTGTETGRILSVRVVVGRGDITFDGEATPND
ncbi:MAG: PspC protein [Rhodoglobus sp.]|nr:PspC protein [Rhodoglobus sp.]